MLSIEGSEGLTHVFDAFSSSGKGTLAELPLKDKKQFSSKLHFD